MAGWHPCRSVRRRNYVGSSLALKGGAKVIRPMFFVVLALLLGRLIYGLLA